MEKTRCYNEKGFSIALVLMLITILVVVALAISSISMQNLGFADREQDKEAAYFAACAGISVVVNELYNNPDWSDGINEEVLTSTNGTYSITFNSSLPYYSTNNLNGETAVNRSDGISVPPGFAYIISTGKINNIIQRVGIMLEKNTAPYFPFKWAAFGDEGVTKTGSSNTNSYDSESSVWPYPDLNSGGDIGTNSTSSVSPYAVYINGPGAINGTVYVGEGGDPETAINDVGISYLGSDSLDKPVSMPSVKDALSAIPSIGNKSFNGNGDKGILPPGKYGDFDMTGNCSITLTGGVYSFSDFSQGGTCIINIDPSSGPVIVYINGDISITGGGFVNNSHIASNFVLYGTPSCQDVILTGNPASYCVCYAPNANISIRGTSDMYGSFMGKTVSLDGNGAIKYDKALSNLQAGEQYDGVKSTSWQNVY